MDNRLIDLSKPVKYQNRSFYISNIYFKDSNLPIKIKKCKFKVIECNKVDDTTTFFICEFLNDVPLLYDFLVTLEKNVNDSIIENCNEWFGVDFSQESVDELFISNLKFMDDKSKRVSIFVKTTNNIIDIQNSTIEIDLFIEKVHFDKDKFYIPLISNDYKILQNYNPSQTVAEFSSSEGM